MGRSVSTPMANTTQSMTRCDNLQTRCPARPVSNRACSITAGEITLLGPASRSTTVSASGVGSKQLPCRIIVIVSLKPGFYTHPRLQEATTCAKTNGIGLKHRQIDQFLKIMCPAVRQAFKIATISEEHSRSLQMGKDAGFQSTFGSISDWLILRFGGLAWHHERLILTANLTLPDFVSFVALGPV